MNVQLSGNRVTTRPCEPQAESAQLLARPALLPQPLTLASRLALTVDDQQKWLAIGTFYLLAGFIISNSGWSSQALGYPMMALGPLLLLVPLLIQRRLHLQARQLQASLTLSSDERRRKAGRRVVYELHSGDYSPAG